MLSLADRLLHLVVSLPRSRRPFANVRVVTISPKNAILAVNLGDTVLSMAERDLICAGRRWWERLLSEVTGQAKQLAGAAAIRLNAHSSCVVAHWKAHYASRRLLLLHAAW